MYFAQAWISYIYLIAIFNLIIILTVNFPRKAIIFSLLIGATSSYIVTMTVYLFADFFNLISNFINNTINNIIHIKNYFVFDIHVLIIIITSILSFLCIKNYSKYILQNQNRYLVFSLVLLTSLTWEFGLALKDMELFFIVEISFLKFINIIAILNSVIFFIIYPRFPLINILWAFFIGIIISTIYFWLLWAFLPVFKIISEYSQIMISDYIIMVNNEYHIDFILTVLVFFSISYYVIKLYINKKYIISTLYINLTFTLLSTLTWAVTVFINLLFYLTILSGLGYRL